MSKNVLKVRADFSRDLAIIGTVACCLMLVLMLLPWRPVFPDGGLDPSWQGVIEWGFLQGRAFGEDLVFTFGPLGFLYTRLYHPELFSALMTFWFFTALLLGLFFGGYWGRAPWPLSLILALGLLLAISLNTEVADAQLFFIPLAGAILALDPVRSGWRWLGYPLLALAALAGLIKFTVFMAGAAVFAIVDVVLWWRERAFPHRLALFLAISWVCFLTVTGHGDWPAYLLNSLRIAGGYSAAMQVAGPLVEIQESLVMGGLLSLVLIMTPTGREGGAEGVTRIGVTLASVVIGFLMFKAGVVRHDGHILITAGGLLLLAVLVAWRAAALSGNHWLKALAAGAVVLGAYHLSGIPERHYPNTAYVREAYLMHLLKDRTLGALRAVHTHIFGLAEPEFVRLRDQALTNIRDQQPLPARQGSVDIYNWDQAAVLANDFNYAPRPVFQSYSAYSPALLQMNADHLAGDEAPDYLFFSVQAIDNRLPALEDGLSWPLLWTRYDPIDYQGSHLLLKRRQLNDKILILGAPQETSLGWEEPLVIPTENGSAPCIWASISLRNSLLGSLVTAAYKAPAVFMTLDLKDGSSHRRRFIPGMGSTGFLLSPYVMDVNEFDGVCMAGEGAGHHRVKAVRFHMPHEMRFFYQEPILVTIRSLEVAGQSEHPGNEAYSRKHRWQIMATEMLQTGHGPCGAPPSWKEGRILAHADCELRFFPGTAKTVKIKFGLYQEALRSQETDGVHFKVRGLVKGEWQTLAARDLRPSSEPTDRQGATFDIDLPPGVEQIQLLTTMIGHAIWDWAYWGPITLLEGKEG